MLAFFVGKTSKGLEGYLKKHWKFYVFHKVKHPCRCSLLTWLCLNFEFVYTKHVYTNGYCVMHNLYEGHRFALNSFNLQTIWKCSWSCDSLFLLSWLFLSSHAMFTNSIIFHVETMHSGNRYWSALGFWCVHFNKIWTRSLHN